MAQKPGAAVLFTQPETALAEDGRLFELAGGAAALQARAPAILKDNITWHFPMPGLTQPLADRPFAHGQNPHV